MVMEIHWKADREYHSATRVLWDTGDEDRIINPGRVPTEAELSACPKTFRCYNCQEKHRKEELGGRYHDKWFCRFCVPFIDEWTAGAMVWWEKKRKRPSHGKPGTTIPLTKAERMASVLAAVHWAEDHGYPRK